jgi:ADP-heptose:LPS heptosyltransferase
VFVGGDSGPRHLAAMMNMHIVTFDLPRGRGFGPFAPAAKGCSVPATPGPGPEDGFDFEPGRVVDAVVV